VLAIAYSAALLYNVPALAAARSILLIIFVGLCAGSYGHLVNDIFDIDADRKAGKQNHMTRFAPWQRFALCALGIVLGFAPAAFVSYSRLSLALLAVEYLLPTIYSIPPIRLKERGTLGVLCDSLGAHAVPCLYTISVLAHESPDRSNWGIGSAIAFPICGAVWALCIGVKGILIHEFQDREADLASGVDTFATRLSFANVRKPITLIFALELAALTGMLILLLAAVPLAAVAAAAFAVQMTSKVVRNWNDYGNFSEPKALYEWWQISHPFYECYFPLAAAVQCAWRSPELSIFPVLQLLLFKQNYGGQMPEMRAFFRSIRDLLHSVYAKVV
jgi:4-hydroxybenzoate polyprenyltransferase